MKTDIFFYGGPPVQGQRQRFPGRFISFLQRHYPWDGKLVLSMFAGEERQENWITTDIRAESNPDCVAPYDQTPFPDNTFDMVIADPPYTAGFSFDWKTAPKDLPKPRRILKEGTRLVIPGGLVLVLHILIIPAYKEYGLTRVGLHPVFCGPNNVIRVLNVLQKSS